MVARAILDGAVAKVPRQVGAGEVVSLKVHPPALAEISPLRRDASVVHDRDHHRALAGGAAVLMNMQVTGKVPALWKAWWAWLLLVVSVPPSPKLQL